VTLRIIQPLGIPGTPFQRTSAMNGSGIVHGKGELVPGLRVVEEPLRP
jgi:hypothetical protein